MLRISLDVTHSEPPHFDFEQGEAQPNLSTAKNRNAPGCQICLEIRSMAVRWDPKVLARRTISNEGEVGNGWVIQKMSR